MSYLTNRKTGGIFPVGGQPYQESSMQIQRVVRKRQLVDVAFAELNRNGYKMVERTLNDYNQYNFATFESPTGKRLILRYINGEIDGVYR